MLDGQPTLEPSHPEPRMIEIDLIAAQADRLADPQTMAVHHQDQQIIANALPALLGGIDQAGDLRLAQEVLAATSGGRVRYAGEPKESRAEHAGEERIPGDTAICSASGISRDTQSRPALAQFFS
jgi:hypothetical protein